MSFDDDLRASLHAEAGHYAPADDGWDDIEAGVRAARARRRTQTGLLGAAAAIVLVAGVALSLPSEPTDVEAGRLADQPTTSSTTTAPDAPAGSPFPGIWPFASQEAVDTYVDGDASFDDPAATAGAFAREYLGMVDPVVVEGESAGEGAVEVEVRPEGEDGRPVPDGGPSTTLTLLRYETSLGATVFTVSDARSPNIVVEEPDGGGFVSSPVVVSGDASGYEGTVVVQVRQDGMRTGRSLGEGTAIAGAGGELEPFRLDLSFGEPTEPAGALVVTTDSGLDGVGVPEATVVRVGFRGFSADDGELRPAPAPQPRPRPTTTTTTSPGPGAGDQPPSGPCAAPGGASAPTGQDAMEVTIFLVCDAALDDELDPQADEPFVATTRVVPRTAGVLRASIEELLRGTTSEERDRGLSSTFSGNTDILRGVTIGEDGTAVVDFAEPLDGASTSHGSRLFRGQLSRTVLQFSTVERVEYRLGGSCEAFWEWQQIGPECRRVTGRDG